MSRWHAFVGLTALTAGVTSAPSPTPAQQAAPASAADLVAQGEQLAQDARYDEALVSFKAAAELEPTANHECYVAYTYFRMQRFPEAWLHFDDARARNDGTAADWCETTLAADLKRGLRTGSFAPVTITTDPPGARVEISSLAAGEVIQTPRVVWLAYGTHELRVTRDGFRAEQVEIAVRSAQPMPVQVALAPIAAGPGATATADTGRRDDLTPGSAPPPHDRSRPRPLWGWITLSAGIAAGAAGGWFHAQAVSSKHDAEALLPGPEFDARLDDFERQRALAIGGYAVGAVAAGVGLYMILRARDRGGDDRLAGVDVAPDSVALWVRWQM